MNPLQADQLQCVAGNEGIILRCFLYIRGNPLRFNISIPHFESIQSEQPKVRFISPVVRWKPCIL